MGILYAGTIIILWVSHLIYCLINVQTDFSSPLFYFHILVQTYIFTGLFITAHDSMHGTVSNNKTINSIFGWTATFLFAGLSYRKLLLNHKLHHNFPGTEEDPDFSVQSQNVFVWWMIFLFRYVSILQLIVMAAAFNILKLLADDLSVISFWVVPAILSTFQLFYFGTYKPHMRPHVKEMKPHNARTLNKNHLWAMLSCYFFGYHHEHHESPQTPWWKMYKLKEMKNSAGH